jgi:hypothetical protein
MRNSQFICLPEGLFLCWRFYVHTAFEAHPAVLCLLAKIPPKRRWREQQKEKINSARFMMRLLMKIRMNPREPLRATSKISHQIELTAWADW